MTTLLVFSHLRWNFVYQRPQHILARLARRYRVVFVEEPVRDEGPTHLEAIATDAGVEVLRPHTPLNSGGFDDGQIAAIRPLLETWLAEQDLDDDCLVWFYTPMALPLLGSLRPRLVLYDCMDELSAFLGAPPELLAREQALLDVADVVLTGGPSLYEAKRERHANVICLPSSVDAAHFAAAANAGAERSAPAIEAEQLQAGIGRPRLGFFGVVDERMDLRLIAQLAEAAPAWQIVMVGPVVKIDSATLPRHANIHWLGQQSYATLPWLVESWDVCLMPFAINQATRFISPTKTLEYMAAGKPVVSTPIRDVQTLYGDVVAIAADAPTFVAACRAALDEGPAVRSRRLTAMAIAVSRSSWDRTAAAVAAAIDSALQRRAGVAALPAATVPTKAALRAAA